MARLFARVFEHTNYTGQYRWIRSDIRNIPQELGFNDKVSSIIVYRGNDYQNGDKIRFYQHSNFGGGYLDLDPGYYPNIHIQPFSFGDKISSVDIRPAASIRPGLTVRLRVRLYEHINYNGQYRDILWSENSLNDLGFNDKVSSIRVFAGEDYTSGWVCDFYEHDNYNGGTLQSGYFGPGTNIPNIKAAPYSFNDRISSVRIYRS